MAVKATLRRGGGKISATHDDTPSGTIIAAANQLLEVKTAGGIVLKFRKMTAAREMQLSRIFTAPVTNNMFYQWCWFAASIAEIGNEIVTFPQTELECMAIVERVGDDGIMALQQALTNGKIK